MSIEFNENKQILNQTNCKRIKTIFSLTFHLAFFSSSVPIWHNVFLSYKKREKISTIRKFNCFVEEHNCVYIIQLIVKFAPNCLLHSTAKELKEAQSETPWNLERIRSLWTNFLSASLLTAGESWAPSWWGTSLSDGHIVNLQTLAH